MSARKLGVLTHVTTNRRKDKLHGEGLRGATIGAPGSRATEEPTQRTDATSPYRRDASVASVGPQRPATSAGSWPLTPSALEADATHEKERACNEF